MHLTEPERELLERSLDLLITATSLQEYEAAVRVASRALAIIRERPANTRRVRSDFNQRRAAGQMELGA